MYILNFQWNLKVSFLTYITYFTVETSRSHSAPKTSAVSHISSPLKEDWISVIQGSPAHAKGCMGNLPCLNGLRCSGLPKGRWLPDWWSSHPETEGVKGNRTTVGVCTSWAGSYGSLIPRAEWVLFTSYFTESQFSENVLTVSKWHFYVA